MRHRRRALAKYALPLSVVGIAVAPALATGAPATFAPPVSYPLGLKTAFNMEVGDFNGDGNLDAVVGSSIGTGFAVVPGSGDGTFGTATTFTTASNPFTVATGDLTGDNKTDFIFQMYDNYANLVAINQTLLGGVFNFTSPAAPTALPAPDYPETPALGDLNEDGKLDIVQPGYADGTGQADAVNVRMGNGDGTFQAASQPFTSPTPGKGTMVAAIADVNGDGHLDVVVGMRGQTQQGSILTALGNGDGTFHMPATPRTFTGTLFDPTALVLADLNGDAHLDAITVNTTADVSVMLGNGDGTFGTATVDSSLHGYDGAVADLNGDGINDIAVADPWSNDAIDVELGNGDGTFGAVTNFALPAGSWPYGIAMADVNGDGLKDILTSTYGTQSLDVMINTSVAMAPAVTSVAPATGPDSGGTSVTITGTAFTGATAVTFGGVAATSFTVNSPTSITAVAPPHAAGAVAIAVTSSNGTGTGAGLFTYTGAPGPAPDSGGGSTPPASDNSLPTATTQPATPGRLSMSMPRTVRGRTLVSTGVVPAGADRVVQTATGGASSTAHAMFGAWATARAQTTCPISTANGRSIFTCSLRLAPGRWTVSTQAMSGTTTVATSSVRVRMKTASRLSVTG